MNTCVFHSFQSILSYLYLGDAGGLDEAIVTDVSTRLRLRQLKPPPAAANSAQMYDVLPQLDAVAGGEEAEKVRIVDGVAQRLSEETLHPAPEIVTEKSVDLSFCQKCDLLFISKEEFLAHRSLDCTRKFTCKTCGNMFTKVQELLAHLVSCYIRSIRS